MSLRKKLRLKNSPEVFGTPDIFGRIFQNLGPLKLPQVENTFLVDLPWDLKSLKSLTSLSLRQNRLVSLGVGLGYLSNLKKLTVTEQLFCTVCRKGVGEGREGSERGRLEREGIRGGQGG
jgi:hypothetical protein